MNPNKRDHIASHAVREATHARQEAFVEFVLSEAGSVTVPTALDRDAIVDALDHLYRAGYPVDDADEADAVGFASLSDYHRLRDAEHATRRVVDTGPLRVGTVRFYGSAHFPEGTLLVVHPYATAPTYPADIDRPWIVRDADGLVRIEVHG